MRFCVRVCKKFHKELPSKNKRSMFLSVGKGCAAKAQEGIDQGFGYFALTK